MPRRKDIYMIIGIMGAMPDEVDQLCAKLENVTVEPYGGVEYHKGTLAGKQVVVCCAGMGKANAAATTQVLITRYGAEKIIFSGIAGNMTSKIGIGDVVIGKTVLYHDAQLDMICQNPPYLKEYAGDPALIAAAEKACAEAGVKALTGKIATGDLFVGDSETKAAIEAKCAPDCVEMEGQRRRGRPRGAGGEEIQHRRVRGYRHQDRGGHGGSTLSSRSRLYRNCSSFSRFSSSRSCSFCIRRLEPGAASG